MNGFLNSKEFSNLCQEYSINPVKLSAPKGVTASDGTYTNKVRISWQASSGATSYEIWRGTSSSTASATTKVGFTARTYYYDYSGTPGKKYYYWVKAFNSLGESDFSAYNNGYRKVPVPLAPKNVAASDGTYTDKIKLSWIASSGATSYEVWRGTSSKTSSATRLGTVTSVGAIVTGGVAGKTYYFWVKAKNSSGTSGFSSYNTGYRKSLIPPAPTNVAASDGTYTDKVQLSWKASSGATSYEVWRGTSSSTSSATKIGTVTSAGAVVTGGTAGKKYYFWIKAKNSHGTSGFSSYNTGYKKALSQKPAAPSNLTATPISSSSIKLQWSDRSTNETGFKVYRKNGNQWTLVKTLGAGVTSYTNTGLKANTTYTYTVQSYNSAGASQYNGNGTVSAKTKSGTTSTDKCTMRLVPVVDAACFAMGGFNCFNYECQWSCDEKYKSCY